MSKISIVDDDAALRLLAEGLEFLGHTVHTFTSVDAALRDIDYISASDLVVLDLFMEQPASHSATLVSGIRSAGMVVHKAIRSRIQTIPILVYSACQDEDTIALIRKDPYSRFAGKWALPSMRDVVDSIQSTLGIEPASPRPKVFIVHGHNDRLKNELKNYLQNTLHFPEPIILHEQPSMGKTLIQKFEDHASLSDLAFVLLTPDDMPASLNDGDDTKRRARQNVILEMGFFLGTLGRETGRVFLLYVGPLELPSDLSGVVYIDVSQGIQSAGEAIRRELKNVDQRYG